MPWTSSMQRVVSSPRHVCNILRRWCPLASTRSCVTAKKFVVEEKFAPFASMMCDVPTGIVCGVSEARTGVMRPRAAAASSRALPSIITTAGNASTCRIIVRSCTARRAATRTASSTALTAAAAAAVAFCSAGTGTPCTSRHCAMARSSVLFDVRTVCASG